ncbi:MAG: 7-cyano-7-deazaguanine synthase [Lentisphaerae bacterium]|nr:7-cyano-7-deazaguanine synthase [Lentisphaerota bacterium]
MRSRVVKKGSGETLVLLSGGIDSAACLDFYIAREERVRAMFVEYGQLAVTRERNAARRVATHFDIPLYVWATCCSLRRR